MGLQSPDEFLRAMGGGNSLPRMEMARRQRTCMADNGLQDVNTPRKIPADEKFSGLFEDKDQVTLLEFTRLVDQPLLGRVEGEEKTDEALWREQMNWWRWGLTAGWSVYRKYPGRN